MHPLAVPSTVEALDELHQATGWIPSRQNVISGARDREGERLNGVEVEQWASKADWCAWDIFGAAHLRQADGKYAIGLVPAEHGARLHYHFTGTQSTGAGCHPTVPYSATHTSAAICRRALGTRSSGTRVTTTVLSGARMR